MRFKKAFNPSAKYFLIIDTKFPIYPDLVSLSAAKPHVNSQQSQPYTVYKKSKTSHWYVQHACFSKLGKLSILTTIHLKCQMETDNFQMNGREYSLGEHDILIRITGRRINYCSIFNYQLISPIQIAIALTSLNLVCNV